MPDALAILSSTGRGRVLPHTLADIQHALARLGHRVFVQDNAAYPRRPEAVLSIVDGLVQVEPELFATVDHVALLPDVLSVLDRPPKVLCWMYDAPASFIRPEFLAVNSHLHLFCWDRAYIPRLHSQGFTSVHYQPLATNPEVYRPLPPALFDYEVSFVGAFSPRRKDLLLHLAQSGFAVDVFGDEAWGSLSGERIRFRGFAHNRTDCPRIYSRSKINLNITSEQLLTALPVRVFDVLACDGFLLTDRREDATRLFEPGRELALYEDAEDLTRRVRHFLEHPKERDAIRQAGGARVRREYTFEKILPGMLEKVMSSPVDARDNHALAPDKMGRALWLAGVSYMKFGKFQQSYPRLLDALRLRPQAQENLFAMALLARETGQTESVASCMEPLEKADAAWKPVAAELRAGLAEGRKTSYWDRLYTLVYPGLSLQPDGTVEGWNPVKKENGSCKTL